MTRALSLVVLAGCLTACRSARPAAPADPPVPVAFDHVVVAIDSFARGVELLRAATGVVPFVVEPDQSVLARAGGGEGTQSALLQNASPLQSAIIGLGDGRYLEIVGPGPAGLATPEVRDVFAIFRHLEPLAWGVRTPDVTALREVLVTAGRRPGEIHGGERTLVGVRTLRWRSLTPWANVSTIYPVFIEWDRSGGHPSSVAPAGCTLVGLTLANPSADSMRAALAQAGVRATVVPAAKHDMSLSLDCPAGEVHLGR